MTYVLIVLFMVTMFCWGASFGLYSKSRSRTEAYLVLVAALITTVYAMLVLS